MSIAEDSEVNGVHSKKEQNSGFQLYGEPFSAAGDIQSVIADLNMKIAALKSRVDSDITCGAGLGVRSFQERIDALEVEKIRLLSNPDLIRKESGYFDLSSGHPPISVDLNKKNSINENPAAPIKNYGVGSVFKPNPALQTIYAPVTRAVGEITDGGDNGREEDVKRVFDDANTSKKEDDFLYGLLTGRFGLAKVFWLYCILPKTLLLITLRVIPDAYITTGLLWIVFVAEVFMCFCVWQAANQYSGFALWKWLSKFYVVFVILTAVLSFPVMF